ncbi:acyl-(acyl-carrier-protein)--UDP-N-acetylglucosamine O-acyltransferase [Candidatus Magnetoovum chiemensis]|nr:acyl-(acyl-carrier-protein)--UDP-N-acetylglucosamine O-acyltransferase [Candidatus Magnetoovum chiemensis]
MSGVIHPTSIVDSNAQIEEDVEIGPYCIIKEGVTIKKGTKLISNVYIEGKTEIGENCVIYPFTSLGLPPQDVKYDWRSTSVKIGCNNIIREYTTIHRASVGGSEVTQIGDDNFIMAYVHIAHDCKIGNSNIMANLATLAGNVEIEDFVVIGGIVAIHQFTKVGAYAMVGGFSGVGKDISPYTIASGPRAKLFGLNIIGLRRRGFKEDDINILKTAYKIIFRSKLTIKDAIKKIREKLPACEHINNLITFINNNKRGICR